MSTPQEAAGLRIYAPNVQANMSLHNIKFYSACFAGATAGILGLENWRGFALFLFSTMFTSLCIYTINCRGSPAKFFPGGFSEMVNPGTENVSTFVLVWTLLFGIVHGQLSSTLQISACSQFSHSL
jgi:ER membrane protein complex subunit 6